MANKNWKGDSRKQVSKIAQQKWQWTAGAVALTGVLVLLVAYMIWKLTLTYTYFELIRVGVPKELSLPPIQCVDEDLKALQALEAAGTIVLNRDYESGLGADLTSSRIGYLEAKIRTRLELHQKRDRLIVYVSAYGICDSEGNPFLLPQDFEVSRLESQNTGLPVKRLLELMTESPAATKLLVLDANHITYDPRLGIIQNDFVAAVQSLVEAAPADPTMWVVCSSSLNEQPQVRQTRDGSVFGYHFFNALMGNLDDEVANQDDDPRNVMLSELLQTVWNGCGRYGQTPVVMEPGKGLSMQFNRPEFPGLLVTRLPAPSKEEDDSEPDPDAAEDPASESTDDAKQASLIPGVLLSFLQNDGAEAAGSGEKQDANASETPDNDAPFQDEVGDETTSTADEAAADSPPLKSADAVAIEGDAFLRAWAARDETAAQQAGEWKPTYYAPYLWRKLNATLVDLKQRRAAGITEGVEEAIRVIDAVLRSSEAVSDEAGDIPSAELVKQLIRARDQMRLQPGPKPGVVFDDAVVAVYQLRHDLVDLVRWHGRATLIDDRAGIFFEDIEKLANSILSLQTKINAGNREEIRPSEILISNRDFADVRRKIVTDRLNKAEDSQKITISTLRHIDLLLATPIPTASERLRLERISRLEKKTIQHEQITPASDAKIVGNTSRVSNQRRLESLLLQIGGDDATDLKPADPTADVRIALATGFGETTAAWLVDPRDRAPAEDVSGDRIARLGVDGPQEVLIRRGSATRIRVTCSRNTDATEWTLKWDSIPPGIQLRSGSSTLSAGDAITTKFDQQREFDIEMTRASAMRERGPVLRATISAAGIPAEKYNVTVKFDVLSLVASPQSVTTIKSLQNTVEFRPFPGRSTPFQLAIRNYDKPAQYGPLKVDLFALPPDRSGRYRPGQLFANGQPTDHVARIIEAFKRGQSAQYKHVAQATDVPLPADDRPGRVTLKPVEAAAPAGSPKTKPTPSDVANGLIAVVTDNQSGKSFFPIEITPLKPRDYLNVDFEAKSDGIYATFSPIDANSDGKPDRWPEDIESAPMFVNWEIWEADRNPIELDQGSAPPRSSQAISGELGGLISGSSGPNASLRLSRQINLGNGQGIIARFSVDHYPRAFIQQIRRSGNNVFFNDRFDSVNAVRINSMHIEQPELEANKNFKRLYHSFTANRANEWNRRKSLDDQLQKDLHPFFAGPLAVFPRAGQLVSEVQVDCFPDIFDRLEISFRGKSYSFRTQRRSVVTSNVDGTGRLVLNTRVLDHRINLNFAGYATTGPLTASLFTLQSPVVSEADKVIVSATGAPIARYQLVPDTPKIRMGESWRIRLDVPPGELGIESARAAVIQTQNPDEASEPTSDDGVTLLVAGEPKTIRYPPGLKFNVGENSLYIKCWFVDRLGRTGSVSKRVIVERPPEPVVDAGAGGNNGTPAQEVTPGTLWVRIYRGDDPDKGAVQGVVVQTEVDGETVTATSNGSGNLRFRNVPAGTYKLKVIRGTLIGGKDATGEKEVTIAKQEDFASTKRLQVTPKQ